MTERGAAVLEVLEILARCCALCGELLPDSAGAALVTCQGCGTTQEVEPRETPQLIGAGRPGAPPK